jgi:hypothetical protein
MMLWPYDETARQEALATSSVECLLSIADRLPREGLLDLALLQRETLRVADVQERSRARFFDGVRAGKYLQETVGLIAMARPMKMSEIARRLAKGLPSPYPSINTKTFETHLWKRHRPVAHFWAASLDLNFARAGGGYAFPCQPAELGDFLATAEAYRKLGERTRARQSRHTVLDPSETVKLPQALNVPVISLQFEIRAQG